MKFWNLSYVQIDPSLNTHTDISSLGRSKFWSESSSTSILCVCEQQRLGQACKFVQARLRLCCSTTDFPKSHQFAHIMVGFRVHTKKLFSYFSTKTYVVGTQNNRLSETVLLSTQNICSNWWIRKYLKFNAKKFCLSKLMALPASKGKEREESSETVSEMCIILRQRVVPEKYQMRQDLGGYNPTRQQQLGKTFCSTSS